MKARKTEPLAENFKPMLAATPKKGLPVKFPVLISAKLDGWRACVLEQGVRSRTLKPIPNVKVSEMLARPEFRGLDGELIFGSPTEKGVMNRTHGALSRFDGPGFDEGVVFHVFDDFTDPNLPYAERIASVRRRLAAIGHKNIRALEQLEVSTMDEVMAYEQASIDAGYEGLMIRSLRGRYKYGRATEIDGSLTKLKRFIDAEAVIVGVVQGMRNDNVATTNELGRTQRSSAKEGKTPLQQIGAFECRCPIFTDEFSCGSGISPDEGAAWWQEHLADPQRFIGKVITFKFEMTGSSKEAPRHPVFVGFREDLT